MTGPLDDVRVWFARFVATMTPEDLDLLSLWAVHTHVVVETYTTPRLQLDSPVPGSGKTTTLEHLQRLCADPVLMASVSSSALLVRMLEAGPRTLLIDEADRTLRPDKPETADVLAILNSGYKRGATRPVLVPVKGGGWESREMPTFAPVAIAGNAPALPADTATRMIRVLLMPDLDGTVDESDWELIEDSAAGLRDRITTWCDQHRDQIRTERPVMPAGVVGRFREKWQPLARVAAVAGGRWPAVVAELAVADVEQVARDREDGMILDKPHVVLLRHLATVWPVSEFAATTVLVADLAVAHPEVWGESSRYGRALTVQRFGRMLATSFKVNSTHSLDKTRRGYRRTDLLGAWRRMGIDPPGKPSGPSEASEPSSETTDGLDGLDGPDGSTPTPCTACGDPLHPALAAEGATTHPTCSEVTQ